MDELAEFRASDLKVGDVVFTITNDIVAGSARVGVSRKLTKQEIKGLIKTRTLIIDGRTLDVAQLFMHSPRLRMRVLLNIFPVWLRFQDQDGKELNEITGFWATFAHYFDEMCAYLLYYFSFGMCARDMFAFFPYKANNCKYWYQAIICALTNKKWK